MVASRTLRLAAATRFSSEVSSGSLKMFHQFGSIGSGTGVLIGVGIAAILRCDENQLAGDHMDCFFQFGPTVQPGSMVLASNPNVSQPRGSRARFCTSRRLLRTCGSTV
jgi:hypothetical protein